MTRLTRLIAPLVLISALLCMSGCFSRQLVRFSSHPQKSVVLLETIDSTHYVFWSAHERVFWSCAEHDTTLECSRRCGKSTDLRCPELSIFQDAVGTNVR